MKTITSCVFLLLTISVSFSCSKKTLKIPLPVKHTILLPEKPQDNSPKTIFLMNKTITLDNLILVAPALDNFNGEIDWGDGTIEFYQTKLSHSYQAPGDFTVRLIGKYSVSKSINKLEINDLNGIYLLDLSKF